ncbi:MAG: hypothetical protein IPL42_02535 [Saprospiraceae bacterium]|nr:hypothetical protein [Saprospiraceae bacterium]
MESPPNGISVIGGVKYRSSKVPSITHIGTRLTGFEESAEVKKALVPATAANTSPASIDILWICTTI